MKTSNKLEYKKITNIKVSGIYKSDYPDFADAYIESADYNGEPMSEEQIEQLNEDSSYVYDCVMKEII